MKKKLIVLKKAKDFSKREIAGCGLPIKLIKIPAKNC